MIPTDFFSFIETIKKKLRQPLPGPPAQRLMVPPTRKVLEPENSEQAKPSAVLILFYPCGHKTCFILIERAQYEGVHSGQIAFPGGQADPGDIDLKHTALREAQEETGINPKKVEIAGQLTKLYIPPSGFDVYPFVGYTTEKPDFRPDHTETKAILEIDLNDFLNPDCRTIKTIRHRTGKTLEVPCFFLNGKVVWGATAMILSELLTIIEN